MSRIDLQFMLGEKGAEGREAFWKSYKEFERNLYKILVLLKTQEHVKKDPYPELGSIANDVAPVTGKQFIIELHEFKKIMESEEVSVVDKAWEAIQLIARSVALTDEEAERVNSFYQCVAQEWLMRRHLMTHGPESFRSTFFGPQGE